MTRVHTSQRWRSSSRRMTAWGAMDCCCSLRSVISVSPCLGYFPYLHLCHRNDEYVEMPFACLDIFQLLARNAQSVGDRACSLRVAAVFAAMISISHLGQK